MDQTELRYSVSLALILILFFKPSPSSSSYTYTTRRSSSSINATTTTSIIATSSRLTDEPDTDGDCDEVVLIDSSHTTLHGLLEKLTDYIKCPANKTAGRCTIAFRGKSDLLRKTFKLCSFGYFIVPPLIYSKITITITSSEKEIKFNRGTPFRYNNEVCAPPNEDLQVIYEWDKHCLPDYPVMGNVYIEQQSVFGRTINLVTSHSLVRTISRNLHEHSRITIVSSYEPQWSEKMIFCEGHIYPTTYSSGKFCFQFEHFTVYPGGASLQIRTRKKKLMFNYHNRIPKSGQVCISALKYDDMVIKVVPGKDPHTKFQHAFLLHVSKTTDVHDNYDNHEETHDYDDDSLFSKWWMYFIMTCIIFGCTCFCHRCCRRKKAASSHEAPKLYRSDEPTAHPAFVNVSRYSTARPPLLQSAIPSVQENNRNISTEQHMMMVVEPRIPRMEQSTAEPHSDELPSYESLFPGRK